MFLAARIELGLYRLLLIDMDIGIFYYARFIEGVICKDIKELVYDILRKERFTNLKRILKKE